MIEYLNIKNHKALKHANIIDLGKINIICGKNNSGKTTILEALYLMPNPIRDVSYTIRDQKAVQILHYLHRTLNSEGYAFLFYNYISDFIELKTIYNGGKSHSLKFFKKDDEVILNSDLSTKNGRIEFKGGWMEYLRG